ncbi:N-acetylneuraminate synthase [Fulvivirgaceae bacterium PWU5]|uniref:N-acetylneuraminate synthase n=1 Tax=Dawidia cretensis TaxID=2782350 RepID=A0AAP2DXR7_9BACT|nr:N-acetylneuraminate synthase [Dawidia cretensis]MBT1709580.1 N-acetylneuraminate synthase [Dawidia cretensis]
MHPFFEIQGRKIGYDYDPVVIAEIGINHEGSLQTAFEMVDAAHRAGAEIIKHQTHIVEDEMSGDAKKVIPGNADVSIYEIMKRCALNEADERKLMEYVQSKGMIFISTPFSRAAAERLQKFNVPAYKIGSGECNNYPLLEHIAQFGKPIILSTGMNGIDSIRKAVAIFRKHKVPFALLHCTNIYPTPPHLVRLGAMDQLAKEFPDAVVGLSDHTINNLACLGAVALGASVLERHFTDRMDRPGPDIVCSMDPKAMSELIEGAKMLKQERGGEKSFVKEEQPTIDFAYASVVSISGIKKGDVLTKDNIWVKRPGTGEILAEHYENLLGKTVKNDVANDVHLKWSDLD